LITKEIRISSY